MTFAKITKMCQKHGFLKQAILHNQDILKIGPIGASLQENLRNEWLLHMTTNRDLTTFLNPSSFSETFDYAKYLCSEKLPFAITEIVEGKSSEVEQQTNQSFSATLKDENRLLLRCTTFVGPSSSVPYFHQWQRQRKAWWRKFSASPGRYAVTDIQSNEEGDQRVEIQAKYEWGTELLETINLFVGEHENLTLEQLQMKDGRKKVQGHHIVNTSCLSKMLLNTLCDAYEEPPFQNEKRPLLKFHRKLAPFKIAFAISSSTTSSTEHLNELAQYLSKQLRAKKIATLLLPLAHRDSLESQWSRYDEMGVPYQVLLNERTLKNGIVQLRSRDTTLKEQVHVSELQGYAVKLFENY